MINAGSVIASGFDFFNNFRMNIGNALLTLNTGNILDLVSKHQIYKYYITNLVYNRAVSSPFRLDKRPSFSISDRTYTWIDYTSGEIGDCFNFVSKLYSLTFMNSLKQIVYDMGIAKYFDMPPTSHAKLKPATITNIGYRAAHTGNFRITAKIRKFEQHDLDYWNCYGVSIKYLKMANIYPIVYYFINDKPYTAEKHAYTFIEKKDDKLTYKIYQPFSELNKWINGNNFSVWELWTLLPEKYHTLILTSSRKDAISIIENLKLPSTAFQSETVMPKDHVMKDILKRFEKVYLLFDNDYSADKNWGQRSAQKLVDKYNLQNIVIPEEYKSKDFSDLVCNYDRIFAKELIKKLL